MKKFSRVFLIGIFLILFFSFSTIIQAEDDVCKRDPKDIPDGQLSTCIDQLSSSMNQSKTATAGVQKQIEGIKARVKAIEYDLIVKQRNIDAGYKNIEKLEQILNRAIRDLYIKAYYDSPLVALLSVDSASEITQLMAYQKAAADQDKAVITNIALSIVDLEAKKKNLKAEQENLAVVKEKLDKVVVEAQAYQATLSTKIASLSARQQEILAQRLSSLGIPLFASALGGCSSDIGKDPGFSGGFGFFTYGVPNRVGLNQYGALGRAKAGKNADDILRAYYDFSGYKSAGDITIRVNDSNGYDSGNIIWTGSLNDYVKRIYEVPNDWAYESIKAQVIAARSYVVAATNNGASSICANQHCQVFQQGEKGGTWGQAVNDTGTDVMEKDGQVVKAFFSSTHGGYVFSTGDIPGWSSTSFTKRAVDTPNGSASSFDDLKNNAYDKDSPWFYCDWGSRSDYNKTAWLKSEEVADIVNVIMLARADSSIKEHLYQTDKNTNPNPAGTDTWDASRVKSELNSRGITPFNSVSGVNVDVDWGSGKVTTVHISGDTSDPSISGDFFKTYFNLRAPANIQIVGPLFSVERS